MLATSHCCVVAKWKKGAVITFEDEERRRKKKMKDERSFSVLLSSFWTWTYSGWWVVCTSLGLLWRRWWRLLPGRPAAATWGTSLCNSYSSQMADSWKEEAWKAQRQHENGQDVEEGEVERGGACNLIIQVPCWVISSKFVSSSVTTSPSTTFAAHSCTDEVFKWKEAFFMFVTTLMMEVPWALLEWTPSPWMLVQGHLLLFLSGWRGLLFWLTCNSLFFGGNMMVMHHKMIRQL